MFGFIVSTLHARGDKTAKAKGEDRRKARKAEGKAQDARKQGVVGAQCEEVGFEGHGGLHRVRRWRQITTFRCQRKPENKRPVVFISRVPVLISQENMLKFRP